jgi:hypothetical protein
MFLAAEQEDGRVWGQSQFELTIGSFRVLCFFFAILVQTWGVVVESSFVL